MILPDPIIRTHGDLNVVRDDLLSGGTKMRFILPYIQKQPEGVFVYASPAIGYAQVALAKRSKKLRHTTKRGVVMCRQWDTNTLTTGSVAGSEIFCSASWKAGF